MIKKITISNENFYIDTESKKYFYFDLNPSEEELLKKAVKFYWVEMGNATKNGEWDVSNFDKLENLKKWVFAHPNYVYFKKYIPILKKALSYLQKRKANIFKIKWGAKWDNSLSFDNGIANEVISNEREEIESICQLKNKIVDVVGAKNGNF